MRDLYSTILYISMSICLGGYITFCVGHMLVPVLLGMPECDCLRIHFKHWLVGMGALLQPPTLLDVSMYCAMFKRDAPPNVVATTVHYAC